MSTFVYKSALQNIGILPKYLKMLAFMKHDAVVLLFFCIYPNVHLKYTKWSVYFVVA